MELWIIYALIAMLLNGIFSISQKIESEIKLNRNSFLFYCNVGMVICPLLLVISWKAEIIWNITTILLAIASNILYIAILKFRFKCLDYMTSSSYFINYRIFSSILLIFFWQILFQDSISMKEYWGILLGFIIFYLLIEKKYKWEKWIDVKKGYFFLGVSIIISWFLWILNKYIWFGDFSITTFIIFAWITGVVSILLLRGKDSISEIITDVNPKYRWFLIFNAIIFWVGPYFNLYAFRAGWDVAIVYKIISYSLFFPIIFSIVYYKEKVTWKKLLAFALTIVSILLFV